MWLPKSFSGNPLQSKENYHMRYYLILVLLFGNLYAQSPQEIENDLLTSLNQIQQSRQNLNFDSLAYYNQDLVDKLLRYGRNIETLRFDFPRLTEIDGFWISTSADGKFRIYSWDTMSGGTMAFYENVFQYQIGAQSKALKIGGDIEGDPKSFFSEIFQLNHQNKTYYLGLFHAKYSTMDVAQGVKCFKIEDGELNTNAKFIRTRSGLQNTLGFGFDFFSVVNRPERPVKLIDFDARSKTLSIPIVTERLQVTERKIRYRFRNGFFVRT